MNCFAKSERESCDDLSRKNSLSPFILTFADKNNNKRTTTLSSFVRALKSPHINKNNRF